MCEVICHEPSYIVVDNNQEQYYAYDLYQSWIGLCDRNHTEREREKESLYPIY
jgi:hypothetical protein